MKKKTLVLGASLKPNRYANVAIQRLVSNNQPTVAIGLRSGTVDGVEIQTEQIDFEDVHTVTLYLGAKHQAAHYDYIVALNPKRVIFNPGTENPEFYKILKKNNIEIDLACTLVMLATNQY
jgi:hypothetical protein